MSETIQRIKTALAGRYSIEREIGSGGMATVHLAMDLKHGRHVAVKALRSELAATLGAERFLREIRITARLNHPHILPLLDSGHAEGFLFYVMPYVEGASLRVLLNGEDTLTLEQIIRITLKVSAALDHAHGLGVIHRDIKPENILFSEGLPVVADFGIAKAVSAAGPGNLTKSGFPLGTPGYMSPEQAAGRLEADARTDVCGLACVVYEMLIGDTPGVWPVPREVDEGRFADPPDGHRELLDGLPGTLESVLVRALAIRPAQRYETPLAFAKALAHGSGRSEVLEDAETREFFVRASETTIKLKSEAEAPERGEDEEPVAASARPSGVQGPPHVQSPGFTYDTPGENGSVSWSSAGKLRFQREIEGGISEEAHHSLVDEIDSALGIVGRISPFGRSLTWSPAAPSDEERNIVVKISPQDDCTRIHIEERVELSGPAKAAQSIGLIAGAGVGLGVGTVLQMPNLPLALCAFSVAGISAVVASKTAMWTVCRKRRPQLEQLANRLANLAMRSRIENEAPL